MSEEEVPVKVFVRVRPLLPQEQLSFSEVCVRFVSHDQLILGRDRAFRFDHIFPPNATQLEVFEKTVTPLVSACLEGYNATIFAYGQTGSGKSYTMGSEGFTTEGQCGVIPRALEQIFQHIQNAAGVEFRVHVSYIEIYKEELRDLLDSSGPFGDLHIREDEHGNTVVIGATEECVLCVEDALSWLGVGNTARITGATRMNQRSSRSHAIFTLYVEQRWKVLDDPQTGISDDQVGEEDMTVEQCVSSKFHFVDLAGSERVRKTGNVGERFKESIHINTGLLSLGNVISALGDPKRKSIHVPYRDSKITRLLKDSLGGNARTVMMTCLSPAVTSFAENLNSLKYAKRARNICNHPVVNRDPQAHRLQEMQNEIQALRDALMRTQEQQMSKPATAMTTQTVESSVMTELSDVEVHMKELEQELKTSRERCVRYQTFLRSAREHFLVLRDKTSLDPERLRELEEWLEDLQRLEGSCDEEGAALPGHSPISKRALQTIEMLRAELEQCQVDLETDEELFAEKVEELNQLQSSYDLLLQERETTESMWTLARETEVKLQMEVEQLLEKLAGMERELSARESVIHQLRGAMERRDSGGDHCRDVISIGIQVPHTLNEMTKMDMNVSLSGSDDEEGDVSPPPDTSDLLEKWSLMKGRVKTNSLEHFSDVSVLKSLRTLTACLVEQDNLGHAPLAALVSKEDQKSENVELVQTHTIRPKDLHQMAGIVSSQARGELGETPLEPSPNEPDLSRSGGWHQLGRELVENSSSDHQQPLAARPTRLESHPKGVLQVSDEMGLLDQSAMESKKELRLAEEKLCLAHEDLRNLNIKIRLKEELIRELVKNSGTSRQLNDTYLTKIQHLEQEAFVLQEEIRRSQAALQKKKGTAQETSELKQIAEEHKRKLATTESKLAALQKKQRETQRMVQYGMRSEKRIEELESGISRLKNHQEMLKRKLKKQTERKTKLEVDLQKYQQRISELQIQRDQQNKVLKIKTEEVAAAQRKLRHLSSRPNSQNTEDPRVESQKAWLDEQLEKVLQQKQVMATLELELAERERILLEREAIIAERDTLEARRLHSSQAMARDIIRLSLQIDSIEGSLRLKEGELKGLSKVSADVQQTRDRVSKLTKERDELLKQQEVLQLRMQQQDSLLSPTDQRKLHELNEYMEVLEAAIDFKNDSIASKQLDVSQIVQNDVVTLSETKEKFAQLSVEESKVLLARYFDKVVNSRLMDSQNEQMQQKLRAEISDHLETIRKLERSLKQAQLDVERRIITQQKEHEQQLQFLMQQLAENEGISESERMQALEAKVKVLEKDLYYYKKTSRDLKKKLHEIQKGDVTTSSSRKLETMPGSPQVADTTESIAETTGRGKQSSQVPLERSQVCSERSREIHSTEKQDACVETGIGQLSVVARKVPSATFVRKPKKQLKQLSASDIADRMGQKSSGTVQGSGESS